MERWITEDEIMHRIKNHPDLTKDDKEDFYFDIQMLYTGKKGQEKLDKPVIKNQERNKIKKDGIQQYNNNKEKALCQLWQY